MLRFNNFFQTKSSRLLAALCLLLPVVPLAAQTTAVSYEHDIAPIFQQACSKCTAAIRRWRACGSIRKRTF